MKQKLLSGLIALFLCLSNVSAGDNLNDIFKKYQKYKGEEIICEQMDLPKELRKAKAGKTSKDINIDELQQSIDMGFRKAKILVCFSLENVFASEPITEAFTSKSAKEFMNDFTHLRKRMLNDTKLTHFTVNKKTCNVDCFLYIDEKPTTEEGYLFLKMINGSINCIIHFYGELKTEDIIKSIEDGTFIGISGFEPTFTLVED